MQVKNGIYLTSYFTLDVYPEKPQSMLALVNKLNVKNIIENAWFNVEKLANEINGLRQKVQTVQYIASLAKMKDGYQAKIAQRTRQKEFYLEVYELMNKIQAEDIYGQEMLDELMRLKIIRQ